MVSCETTLLIIIIHTVSDQKPSPKGRGRSLGRARGKRRSENFFVQYPVGISATSTQENLDPEQFANLDVGISAGAAPANLDVYAADMPAATVAASSPDGDFASSIPSGGEDRV